MFLYFSSFHNVVKSMASMSGGAKGLAFKTFI